MIVAAVPAFNEEKTIAKVVARAMKHVDKVVVVDDGSTDDTVRHSTDDSTDDTALIAGSLGAHVVRHDENKGCAESTSSSSARLQVRLTRPLVTGS